MSATNLIKAGAPMEPINQGYVLVRGAHAPVVVTTNEPGADAFTIDGKTRDPLKDVTFRYGDGTAETFWYNTAGELAGKSARA